jgi:hypothetical protein
MKLKFLTAIQCFAAILLVAAPPALRAQEKEPPSNEPDQEFPAEPEQPSAEELQERIKQEAAQEKAELTKMMNVFKTLEGAWTGEENLRYEENRLPPKTWKDVWEGKFTFGGRYFEMSGQTSGELASAYKWICTWDTTSQSYQAWYFGDNSQNEYTGKLSQDGKFVTWSMRNPANGAQSRFSMKAEGNRVKCHGTDTLADGSLFSTQTSEYTRKRVEL